MVTDPSNISWTGVGAHWFFSRIFLFVGHQEGDSDNVQSGGMSFGSGEEKVYKFPFSLIAYGAQALLMWFEPKIDKRVFKDAELWCFRRVVEVAHSYNMTIFVCLLIAFVVFLFA